MKKVFKLLILVALCLASFSMLACGGGGTPEPEVYVLQFYKANEAQPQVKTWPKNDIDNFWAGVPVYTSAEKDYYTFLGYFDQREGGTQFFNSSGTRISSVVIDRDMTFYAQWQAKEVTISYKNEAGDEIHTENVVYGSSYNTFVAAPEKEGHDFIGWYSGEKQVSSGTTALNQGSSAVNVSNYSINNKVIELTPKYSIKQITVTYDYNDGRYKYDERKYDWGTDLSTIEFLEEDTGSAILDKWSMNQFNYQQLSGTLKNDITVYAMWREYKTVTLHIVANENTRPMKVFKGETNLLTDATRNGYEFMGWYDNEYYSGLPIEELQYNKITNTKKDYYARWKPITYTLSFSVPSGVTAPAPISYTAEDRKELPTGLLRTNYTFVGWCRNADLSDDPFLILREGTYGIRTLYAKFRGADKILNLKPNGGKIGEYMADESWVTVEYDAMFTVPVATREDYAFAGWYLDESLTIKVTDQAGNSLNKWTALEDETPLYAKWLDKRYITVEYEPASGGEVALDEYYVAEQNVKLTATVNYGYDFEGFYRNGLRVTSASEYNFTMPDEDVTITAKYKMATSTLRLKATDAFTSSDPVTVTFNESFTLPKAYKQGYKFTGWLVEYDDLNEQAKQYYTDVIKGYVKLTDAEGQSLTACKFAQNLDVHAQFTDSGASDEIYVTSVADLKNMSDDKSYVLVQDLDFSGVEWSPKDFGGVLDGAGYKIKNLTITSDEITAIGLFKTLSGTVKNLKFQNLKIVSDSLSEVDVGGLCSVLASKATVDNVEIVSGSITIGVGRVGGIIGRNAGGSVINCINRATIFGESSGNSGSVGGIVGKHESGSIKNTKNYGNVEGDNRIGGIIGYTGSSDFSFLYNYGVVKGQEYVGGVVGLAEGVNTKYSALNNLGSVEGETYVGGVIGCVNSTAGANADYSVTVTKLENSSNVKGQSQVGGIIGRLYAYNNNGSRVIVINVDDVVNSANVSGNSYLGGLIGYGYSETGSSKITDSSSKGTITAEEAYVGGLAGCLDNIQLVNCSNKDTVINSTGYTSDTSSNKFAYLGGYVGKGYYVENCDNEVSFTYTPSAQYVGGVAGWVNANLLNCDNTGNITASASNYVGGVAGFASTGGNSSYAGLTNGGEISGKDYTGGVIGAINCGVDTRSNPTITVKKLENTGNVKGQSQVGGVVGRIYANNSYSGYNVIVSFVSLENTANVSGKEYVGGIIGYGSTDTGSSKISDSSSSGEITGEYYVGGIAGGFDYVVIESCSNLNTTINATGVYIDSSGTSFAYVGGYAGKGYTVISCINVADIEYTKGGQYVGGVIGWSNGYIQECENTGDITATSSNHVGGVAGLVTASTVTYSDLKNSGKICGKDYTGGVIGEIYYTVDTRSNPTITIKKIDNSGEIKGQSQVGGVVGRIYVNNSYSGYSVIVSAMSLKSTANVSGKEYVGGIVGWGSTDTGSSQISDSSFSATVCSTKAYVGGIAGYLGTICVIECSNLGASLTVQEPTIDTSGNIYAYVGGYVGFGYTVENCTNNIEINVTYTQKANYVGGIAGFSNGNIKNCQNDKDIIALSCNNVGGIAGHTNCANSSYSQLTNNGKVSGYDNVGGIIGQIYNWVDVRATYSVSISEVTNTKDILGNNNVGSLFGYIYTNNNYQNYGNKVIISVVNNSGNVEGATNVGILIGNISTDTSESKLVSYTNTGSATMGGDAQTELIGAKYNFAIQE